MKSASELLEIRKEIKNRKPKFTRQEYPARKNLKLTWRKPKGIHSKMKDKKRGKKIQPSVGWKSPRSVRGLSNDGLKLIQVNNINDLSKVTKENIIVLSRSFGNKKRIEILKKIKELRLKILNIKDIDKAISDLVNKFQERIKEKKEKLKAKTAEKKKVEEKPKETKKEEQKITEEEKKVREKEEKRKVLEGKA